MIRIAGVEKHFGDFHALKNINLEVPRGQVIVVLGPSGSGKSTLCRTINRLETIDDGVIEIDGEKLPEEGKDLARLRSEVGMVFQSFNLFPHLTIRDNVTLGPIKVRKTKKADAARRADELLDRVGIAAQASKYPAQLSGGQQQRVAIARALAMEPKVMLFDEPTAALDIGFQLEILELLGELADEGHGIGVVLHDLNLAARSCHRLSVIHNGGLEVTGSAEEVLTPPRIDAIYRISSAVDTDPHTGSVRVTALARARPTD